MVSRNKMMMLAALAGVSAVGVSPVAKGASIDVQFVGPGTTLASTTSAGVVPETNWNTAPGSSWSGLALHDDSGSGSPAATLSGSANGTYFGGNVSDSTGDSQLTAGEVYAGASDNAPGDGNSNMTFATIPYSSYEVIVEAAIDSAGRTETIALTPGGGSTNYYTFTTSNGGSTWVAATEFDGVGTQNTASYAAFTGLTASSFVLNWGAPSNGAINGVQIVETGVPEPMSLGVLGVGAGMLMVRRRRAAKPAGTI